MGQQSQRGYDGAESQLWAIYNQGYCLFMSWQWVYGKRQHTLGPVQNLHEDTLHSTFDQVTLIDGHEGRAPAQCSPSAHGEP